MFKPQTLKSAHEIGKFCSLLSKGNFEAIACLYVDNEKFGESYAYESEEWKELKSKRKLFLTKDCIKYYLTYVGNQLKFLKRRPENHNKKTYHIRRLLYQAQDICDGKEPCTFVEGDRRAYLLKIKTGLIDQNLFLEDCNQVYSSLLLRLDNGDYCVPDFFEHSEFLNDWMFNLRKKNFLK